MPTLPYRPTRAQVTAAATHPKSRTHQRRSFSRNAPSASPSVSPSRPALHGLGIVFHSRSSSRARSISNSSSDGEERDPEVKKAVELEEQEAAREIQMMRLESDQECWERMLLLQREFHCYNSARLEAAVEALDRGEGLEGVRRPSRHCLDLLNEELRSQLEAQKDLFE